MLWWVVPRDLHIQLPLCVEDHPVYHANSGSYTAAAGIIGGAAQACPAERGEGAMQQPANKETEASSEEYNGITLVEQPKKAEVQSVDTQAKVVEEHEEVVVKEVTIGLEAELWTDYQEFTEVVSPMRRMTKRLRNISETSSTQRKTVPLVDVLLLSGRGTFWGHRDR